MNYKNGYDNYKKKYFYLAGYPEVEIYKGDRYISSGKIEEILKNFEFEHTLHINHESSGSHICLNCNKLVIGIHKGGYEIKNYGHL